MIDAFYLTILNFYSIKNLLRWALSSLSGGLASCVSAFCLYPLDNVKTRLQVVQKESANQKKTDSDVITAGNLPYMSVVQQVYKTEGITGFYKGISACLFANFISFGCYFFWYEFFKILLGEFSQYNGYISIVSLFSGMVATTMVNPFWVINARMTISKTKDGFVQTFMSALKDEGIHILWKGVLPSYFLVINPIIQFTIYEELKHSFADSEYQGIIVFLSGALSKIAASFVTYPYQVIRTNLHVNKERIGIFDVLNTIYHSRGFAGFYKGHGAKLSQTALNSGIMLLSYEEIKSFTKILLEALFKEKIN